MECPATNAGLNSGWSSWKTRKEAIECTNKAGWVLRVSFNASSGPSQHRLERGKPSCRSACSKTSRAIYPTLVARTAAGVDPTLVDNAIAASAEGYPFPTNLDRDQPVGDRLTPPSQAEVVRQAVAENWSAEALGEAFAAYDERRRTDDV